MIVLEEIYAGLQVTLIGMLVVFFVLTLLIGCTMLMNRLIERMSKRTAPAPAAVAVFVPAPIEEIIGEEESVEDDSLIAVITAAITAAWQGETADTAHTGAPAFAIKQIRRVGSAATAWGKSGREESIYSRL